MEPRDPPPPDTPDVPESFPQVPGYRLLRVIGEGGMSTVYLAEQLALRREVALKVMLGDALRDETSRRRFEQEARTIARLEHPNIVGIFDVGRTGDGRPYYAMPFLRQGHLAQRRMGIAAGRQPDLAAREVLRGLLQALGYAHARGVVHRDVKAENVLFDHGGRPMLADFGIALHRGHGARVTQVGLAVGSTAYMAPEQARGLAVDRRADLYSVGVLAWELLNDQLPYNAGDALSMALQHAQQPIPRLPPQLRHWQKFIDKAMAKRAEDRFQSAEDMLREMDAVPQRSWSPASVRTDAAPDAAGKRRWKPAMLALAGLAAVATAAALWWSRADAPAPIATATPPPATDTRVASRALPAPQTGTESVLGIDPSDTLLRTAPESPAERDVVAAETLLRDGDLQGPAGYDVYTRLTAALRADPRHARLGDAIDRTLAMSAEQAIGLIGRPGRDMPGDLRAATSLMRQATRVAQLATPPRTQARAQAGSRIADALRKAIQQSLASGDGARARQLAEAAVGLGVERAAAQRLLALAGSARDGKPVATDASQALAGGSVVTHTQYARFAQDTRRPETICRERASLLRIVARRSWKTPGFPTSDGQPVVCVSAADAEAYARWLSQQSGRHYRLPTLAEAGRLGPAGGPRAVAAWTSTCSAGCAKQSVQGASWREAAATRALDGKRGYDDVGIRLVAGH